jgi:hypothetical protein
MTRSAVEAIEAASLPASGMGKETGGILIGPPPTNEAVVITSATGSGPDENCASAGSWETEPDYLNQELRRAREEDPTVNLRGFWHLHPGRMTSPSSQDQSESLAIIQDSEHYRLDELVMPIVTVDKNEITIHCYHISRDNTCFTRMDMEIIPEVEDEAERLSSDPEQTETETGFWHDTDWQFYMTPQGAMRLEIEMDKLIYAGYQVTAMLVDDGNCCIQAWMDDEGEAMLFLLPGEYPLNPPSVFVQHCGEIREKGVYGSSLLNRWSSHVWLCELMEDRLDELPYVGSHRADTPINIMIHVEVKSKSGGHSIAAALQKLANLLKPVRRNEDDTGDSG